MKIHTLWSREGCEDDDLPWLLAATDEVSIDTNNGYPHEFQAALDANPDARLLILEVPNSALKLWEVPVVAAKPVTTPKPADVAEEPDEPLDHTNYNG